VGEEEERKRNSEGVSKGKDHQNVEIFHVSRANMLHTSLQQSSHEEKSGTHSAGKTRDSLSQPEVFHQRSFHSALHHVRSHEDKSNTHTPAKGKQNNPNIDLFQMPHIFQSIITSSSNSEDNKSNFMSSSSTSQHSKNKESQLSVRSFHSDEEKGGYLLKSKDVQQEHNPSFFQSPGSFPSASQSQTSSEEKVNNFHTPSSIHTKNKDLTHPDFYHTGRSFNNNNNNNNSNNNNNNNEDRDMYISTTADKEIPAAAYASENHKGNQGFINSSQTQIHDKIANNGDFHSPKNKETPSTCTNFLGSVSLTSHDSERLALLSQPLPSSATEGLSFLNQQSSGGQDTPSFLNESYSHGQSEPTMETESLNHKPNN
jgi:hypothetical protein